VPAGCDADRGTTAVAMRDSVFSGRNDRRMHSTAVPVVSALTPAAVDRFERDGCLLLGDVFDAGEVDRLCGFLDPLLEATTEAAPIRNRAGLVVAARNVLRLWPDVFDVCRQPRLQELLEIVLGRDCGLVRVLYFDKPPGQTWALPWHKDLMIAIAPAENPPDIAGTSWNKIRMKAGVPHVEADERTLSRMLTLRVHLDPAGRENGALCVSPGSHLLGKSVALEATRHMVVSGAGDVFAMRPLLSHCSGSSASETMLRRRVLHLEFAASRELPHGYRWHTFLPIFPQFEGRRDAGRAP